MRTETALSCADIDCVASSYGRRVSCRVRGLASDSLLSTGKACARLSIALFRAECRRDCGKYLVPQALVVFVILPMLASAPLVNTQTNHARPPPSHIISKLDSIQHEALLPHHWALPRRRDGRAHSRPSQDTGSATTRRETHQTIHLRAGRSLLQPLRPRLKASQVYRYL